MEPSSNNTTPEQQAEQQAEQPVAEPTVTHQPFTPDTDSPASVAPAPVSYSSSQAHKPSKLPVLLLSILSVLLLAGCAYLGYTYKTSQDKLHTAQSSLASTQAALAKEKASNSSEAAAFIATYNNSALSRSLCIGQPLLMSDVHVNSKFIVFRYLCANTKGPILIGAFAKHSSGPTDFTYGSSTLKPNQLPGYIYDSEPNFFGPVYGTTRF